MRRLLILMIFVLSLSIGSFAAGISGTIYVDRNLNSAIDTGEGAPTGSTVYVNLVKAGVVIQSTTMNGGNGGYSFATVVPGTYSLIVTNSASATAATAPTNYSFETPSTGSVSVTVLTTNITQNFALGDTISGTVYVDANDDGLLDSGEVAPTGTVYVNLVQNSAVVMSTTMTAGTGVYTLKNVADGSYSVIITNSATSTTPLAPSGYTLRNPATGILYLTVAGAPFTGENFGVVTTGSCVCGYTDGQLVHYSGSSALTMDGSFGDWAAVLAKPDNNACDPLGTADKDYPIQSTGRDLVQFAYTWDDANFYAYTRRAGSSSNTDNFIYYGDNNNDGKMETGEPVVIVAWQGANRTISVSVGTYSAVASGGDPLTSSSGYGDGYTLPGTVVNIVAKGGGTWGGANGLEMEWKVQWTDLNVASGSAIGWHVSSTNSQPGAGSFPGQVDDNMGGCGACAGSNQIAGVTITGTTAAAGSKNTTVYLPHVITNTGNGTDTFDLTSTTSGSWTPTAIRYYKDLGTIGQYDPGIDVLLTDTNGNGIVDTGQMTRNAAMNILVAADLPASSGNATITTKATSSFVPPCASYFVPTSASAANVVSIVGGIYGTVFNDANHNFTKDQSEAGTGQTVYCKLVPQGNTSATQAAAVNTSTGAYVLSGVASGNYSIVLSTNNTLTSITPSFPTGWIGTEAGSGIRSITQSTSDTLNQDFGLYNGSSVTGNVFQDNGAGQTPVPTGANDGVKNGSETGVGTVPVKALDSGGSQLDSATTDGSGNFTLYIPAGITTVNLVKTDPASWINTGASLGTTPSSSYSRNTDTLTYTATAGNTYTGVQLGIVQGNDFTGSNSDTALPGTVVFYKHVYSPGTSGTVNITVSRVPSPGSVLFNENLYQDVNCNGTLTQIPVTISGSQISGTITVSAGVKTCIVVKEFIPANAPIGATDALSVVGSFTYTNAPSGQGTVPSSVLTRTDETTVGQASDAGLTLNKAVDIASAVPGTTLTYTVTYLNTSSQSLSNVVIYDSVPAYTSLVSAACPVTFPSNLTGCTFTQSGSSLKWQFSGTLAPTATGTISYKVQINP